MRILPDHQSLQYSGRIDFDNAAAPVFVYAASYVKIRFTGTCIKAEIANRRGYWTNYIGVIVDGDQTKQKLAEDAEPHVYTLAENLPDGEHELMLFKRMDSCHIYTFYGFELDEGATVLTLPPLPDRRIEVFGDSVSCGEVSEAVEYVGKEDPVHDGEWSNSWYSYAWMTARSLNAQLHDTSQGGIALLDGTGYFSEPGLLGVESCYDKLEYEPGLSPVKNWDFSKWQPHVVIVAIGQNDKNPEDYMADDYAGEKAARWRSHYADFVRRLMELYPKAQIVLATTLLEHSPNWDRAIGEACRAIGSPRVRHFLYKRNGCGTPGHIRIPEAEEMARELGGYLLSLGDIWK